MKSKCLIIGAMIFSAQCSTLNLSAAPAPAGRGRSPSGPFYDEVGRELQTLEATTVELKDGRILKYIPTDEGRLWMTWSYDGGKKYLNPDRSSVESPLKPCRLHRLQDGNLLLAWYDGETPTLAISTDEGRLWFHRYPLGECGGLGQTALPCNGTPPSVGRDAPIAPPFALAEQDGVITVGIGDKTAAVKLVDIYAKPGKPAEPEKEPVPWVQKRARKYTTADFNTDRPDGRFEKTPAWIYDKLRRTTPKFSFDKVKSPEEVAAWREGLRSKVRELLLLDEKEDLSKIEFRKIWEKPRKGYTLYRYEFYPEEKLAVPFYMLVPDIAKTRQVPAALCYPGSGSSLESLAYEPDRIYTSYRLRNAQAWWYCQAGMIGIALENPATANNAIDNMQFCRSQNFYYGLMGMMYGALSVRGEQAREALAVIDFLRRDGRTDMSRILTSGMSLGAGAAMYPAIASDKIAAVIYNDFEFSGSQHTMAFTEGRGNLGGICTPMDMAGTYQWFDLQPDVHAALAPRPLMFVEGGIERGGIEKVRRAYALAGAPENLCVTWYNKYRYPEVRRFGDVDLRKVNGLNPKDFLEYANVDSIQHSFHPDRVLPWVQRIFHLDAFSDELKALMKKAAAEKIQPYDEEEFK